MKKTLIFILMILVLMVSSCNLFLKEEYGELIVSFDGTMPDGARALDANGLPVLSSSPMKINIIREDGYTITRELGAEEPKSLIELVPIGEKIEIIVTAINPSGQWSGRASHTVVSGQNHVRVLLNKNVSGLKNLLFTQKKTDDLSTPYNLTFYMGGKEINAPQSHLQHNFGRDSKGRLYISVKNGDPYIYRYMSDGVYDTNKQLSSDAEFLANDYTTGNMYGLLGSTINKIEENLTLTSPFPTSPHVSAPFAVDNGIFTWASIGSSVIYLWKAGMGPLGVQGNFSAQATEYKLGTNDGFAIKDIFIRSGYVYVLFAAVRDGGTPGLYSIGAVLKWKIGTDPASGNPKFEGSPVVLGKSAGSPVIENGVLKDYDYSANFYGAVKVIGFDEENIYIADDGFDAADTPAGARIVKNRNRIAALNIATNTLSFSDAGPAKWYNEWKEWRKPNTKMIVWRQELYNKYYYYQLDTGDEALTSNKKFTTDSSGYKDVFCYDLDGNLYIVDDNSKINMYPQTEGIYTNQPIKNTGLPSFKQEKGIAVDTSALDGYKYLYYVDNSDGIKRLEWEKDGFASANNDSSFGIQSTSIQGEVSAMAANKDGLFVAVKKNIPSNKYKITVKKYGRSGSLSEIDISEGDRGGLKNPIVEDVYAMQILDGRLYALSYKTVGAGKTAGPSGFEGNAARAVVSGKLLDLGLTSKNLSARPQTLWSGTQEDKGYAPFRFIAIKPKELVIANDGFYGTDTGSGSQSGNQRNKVLKFSSSGSLLSEVSTSASFSRELSHRGMSCGFIWY